MNKTAGTEVGDGVWQKGGNIPCHCSSRVYNWLSFGTVVFSFGEWSMYRMSPRISATLAWCVEICWMFPDTNLYCWPNPGYGGHGSFSTGWSMLGVDTPIMDDGNSGTRPRHTAHSLFHQRGLRVWKRRLLIYEKQSPKGNLPHFCLRRSEPVLCIIPRPGNGKVQSKVQCCMNGSANIHPTCAISSATNFT